MKRMNVILDHEALEQVRQLTGKKTYSETINHAIAQIARRERLRKAIEELANDPNPWWPGYVEEMAPDVAAYMKKEEKARRRAAANTVSAPRVRKSRGSR